MPDSSETHERLDAIHYLLERERLYRAVSVPTALIAGTLSIVASAFFVWRMASTGARVVDMNLFLGVWTAILAITLGVGARMLSREAGERGKGLYPPAVRLVGGMVMPFLLTAIALGLLLSWRGAAYSLTVTWITLYGLTLVATSHFAPKCIANLGWSFLITGLSLMLFVYLRIQLLIGYDRSELQSLFLMGATFGLFHVIYAVVTWNKIRRESAPGGK